MTRALPLPRLAGLLVGALSAAFAARAAAQSANSVVPTDKSLDVQLFQPAIGPRNFLTIDAAEVPGHKQVGFGLYLNYQDRPYVLTTKRPAPATASLVSSQMTANLSAAVGLFDRLQLGFDLPFTAFIKGDAADQFGVPNGDKLDTYGLGDLRVEAKGLVKTLGADDQFALGASAGMTLPTGKDSAYLGDKSVTGRLKAIAGWQQGPVRAAANLGLIVREASYSYKTELGSGLLYGAAAAYQFPARIDVIAEFSARSGLKDFFQFYKDVNPFEIDVAARAAVSGTWALLAGGGVGLGSGIGAPRYRLLLGAQLSPDFRDRDHDGVADSVDKCPDDPEDRDGFQDADGCPDPDNDEDGILDADDKCPNDPEDKDQFQDADGCPDLDNDGDGIPDINDACPNRPEDGKGPHPTDGCPADEDTDHDGVIDDRDKCPNEPEDRDGFEDDDGCPDPDNDKDGIVDSADACPNEAEDKDGFEDNDGCPDPDNDKDGFPDAQDKCPNEPETFNGVADDDGCPDAGAPIVHFSPKRIQLDTHLEFQTRGTRASSLKQESVGALGTVALLLRAHPEVKKLRIQLQAPGLSTEETQRRADIVRDTLVSKGIEFERLAALGLGAGVPRLEFVVETLAPPAAKPAAPRPASSGKSPTEAR